MKLLILSDGHGNLDRLDQLDEEFKNCDAVVYGGDFAKFGAPETGLPFLEKLCKKHETIFSVIGNCDAPDFIEQLEEKDICAEKSLVQHEGLFFAGSGGGTKFTGTTLNEREESDMIKDLDIVAQQGDDEWNNLVLILHNPPKGYKCDLVGPGIHVGSQMYTDFILKYKPVLAVCGHIHESAAIDNIGDTTLINPGSLDEGKYAVVNLQKENKIWKVLKAEIKQL